jgi:hypothetical protein
MASNSQNREKIKGALDLDRLRGVFAVYGAIVLAGCSTVVFHPSSGFANIHGADSFRADADNLRKTYGNDFRGIVRELERRGAKCKLDRDIFTCTYNYCEGSYQQVVTWVYGANQNADNRKPEQLTHRDGTIVSINVPGHGEFCKMLKQTNPVNSKLKS